MDHASQLVDLVNDRGEVVGSKSRKDIDKLVDVYNGVLVLLITPRKELVLSKIPVRKDLPNLYANLFGAPVATIRRHKETAAEAATRAVSNEIFYDNQELRHIGDMLQTFPDGHRTFMSTYYFINKPPKSFSATDVGSLVTIGANELDAQIANKPERFTPTLQVIWHLYHKQLPL